MGRAASCERPSQPDSPFIDRPYSSVRVLLPAIRLAVSGMDVLGNNIVSLWAKWDAIALLPSVSSASLKGALLPSPSLSFPLLPSPSLSFPLLSSIRFITRGSVPVIPPVFPSPG
ncbi:hypothetical protein PRIPAC_70542 [Pristionchus pacificus]|uniref:Uncharacterized protein n=1 Tax=Pristionchus pacificus TaxID=54126 RepID=A0A2A6CZC9_PRIPA|nr:hypothetical protein PRIPAC_70542 [Pristionchus pacificus]|eukprot:PDM83584.1 hypothetical protein PRIPAC_30071 [Pristionchus pacificus]